MQALILTKTQAEHVMQAMATMNNVMARISVIFHSDIEVTSVSQDHKGRVIVITDRAGSATEIHPDQNAFAAAYGLEADIQEHPAEAKASAAVEAQYAEARRSVR